MSDIEDIKRRQELGVELDHMHDIGITDSQAYRSAQDEYMKLNIRISRRRKEC